MEKFDSKGKTKIPVKELIAYLQEIEDSEPGIEANVELLDDVDDKVLFRMVFIIIDDDG